MELLSDAELARRCRNDDPAAWRELTQRFTPSVYRLCHRMLSNQHEAEDASQETFLRVHRSIGSFDPLRPLGPWISRIAYNVCLKRLQKVARDASDSLDERSETHPDIMTDGNESNNPEHQASRAQEQSSLMDSLARLSIQDRVLLDLRYKEGLSDVDLGEVTGMPVNTVKTRIFRARSFLRDVLRPAVKKAD